MLLGRQESQQFDAEGRSELAPQIYTLATQKMVMTS